MPTKTSTSVTAFDAFFNDRDNAIQNQKESIEESVKAEPAKKSTNTTTPKISKPISSKAQTIITKPTITENLEPAKIVKLEENKEETPQIQRVGFSTILKPDLIRKLKLKALTDDIDIYEAVEKAIELFIKS